MYAIRSYYDFKRSIKSALEGDLSLYEGLLADYQKELAVEPIKLAAAVAFLSYNFV